MRSTPIEPPATPLRDDLVRLRLRRDSDVTIIAAARDDPASRQWLDDAPGAPRSAADLAEIWRRGEAAPMVIADAASDEPVGLINVQFRSDDEATVAYQVFAGRRGRGIAGRALELVTMWAFGELELRRLVLEIDPENTASVRVAEKCGFAEMTAADGPKLRFVRIRPAR